MLSSVRNSRFRPPAHSKTGGGSLMCHACAVALHAMYYIFIRIHQTLKVTPAMAAVSDCLWQNVSVQVFAAARLARVESVGNLSRHSNVRFDPLLCRFLPLCWK